LTGGKAESVGLVDAQETPDLLELALDLGRQLAGDLDARGWEVGGVLDRSPVDANGTYSFEAADTGAGQGAEGTVEVAVHDQLDGLTLQHLTSFF